MNLKTFFLNVSFLGLSTILNKVLRALSLMFIARATTPQEFGSFAIASAVASLLTIFTDFGVHNLVVKEISRNPKSNIFLTALEVRKKLMMYISSAILMYIIIRSPDLYNFLLYILIIVATYLDGKKDLYSALLRGNQKFKLDSTITTVNSFFFLVICLSLFFIKPINGLIISSVYFVFAVVGNLVYLKFIDSYDFEFHDNKLNFKQVFTLILQSLPSYQWQFVFQIMVSMYVQYIGIYSSSTDAAHFSLNWRLVEILMMVPGIILVPLGPKIYNNEINFQKYRHTFKIWSAILLLFTIYLMVSIFSQKIVNILWGSQYLLSANSLPIVLITFFFGSISMFLQVLSFSFGVVRKAFMMPLVLIIINLIYCCSMKNNLNIINSSYAISITSILFLGYQIYASKIQKEVKINML